MFSGQGSLSLLSWGVEIRNGGSQRPAWSFSPPGSSKSKRSDQMFADGRSSSFYSLYLTLRIIKHTEFYKHAVMKSEQPIKE